MTREEELLLKQTGEAFNNMPYQYRKIASDTETAARIRDLLILKDRVEQNYKRELQYINDRIKSYLRTIKR